MKQKENKISSSMIVLPVLFGLAGIGYMIWQEMGKGTLTGSISLTSCAWVYIVLLILCVAAKDFSGMYRTRVMAGCHLGLRQLFRIRMLYEFTNAATPSAAGGSTLEMVFIHREGVKISRATAMTVLALLLDEVFMVVLFPVLVLSVGYSNLFAPGSFFSTSLASLFLIGYGIKLVWTSLLFVGLFVKPQALVYVIGWVMSVKPLRRWKPRVLRTAVEIKYCSVEFRQQPLSFRLKVSLATLGIWSFKFLIANMAIMIFNPLDFADNVMVFSLQYLMAVVCMITPTPGGSGFAEVMFNAYLGPFIAQKMSVVVIASIWRLATYYYYLIAGVVILPKWISGKSAAE